MANIILIPSIGINGAAIATMFSFSIIFILRIIDTRKFVEIKINLKNMITTLLIIFGQIGILYLNISNENIYQLILLTIAIFVNYKEIKTISLKFINSFSRN